MTSRAYVSYLDNLSFFDFEQLTTLSLMSLCLFQELNIGNLGSDAITTFKAKHVCNNICKKLGLQDLNGKNFLSGFVPFFRNKFPGFFQDFCRTQIDFSRALKITLTLTLPRS